MAAPLARFDFRVANPEQRKAGGALDRPYWVYHIQTQTTHERYPSKTPQCVRRFSDFDWLRAALADEFPWCIVPPIPPKDIAGTIEKFIGDQGGSQQVLLDQRQRGLFKFLIRVGAHAQLQHSRLVQDFLEMDEAEWERRMKAPGLKRGTQAQMAAVDSLVLAQGAAGHAVAAVLRGEPQDAARVWADSRAYVEQLGDSIAALQQRLHHLVQRRRGAASALDHFGTSFQLVGQAEAELDGGEETPLCRAVKAVGQHTQQLATIYSEHAEQETQRVVETLQYYSGMCGAVTEALKRAESLTKQRDGAVRADKEAAGNVQRLATRSAAADKLGKAELEAKTATEQRKVAEGRCAAFDAAFREEFRRFHREKQYDVKAILRSFVDLQMDYSDRMKRSWESLLPTVEPVRQGA